MKSSGRLKQNTKTFRKCRANLIKSSSAKIQAIFQIEQHHSILCKENVNILSDFLTRNVLHERETKLRSGKFKFLQFSPESKIGDHILSVKHSISELNWLLEHCYSEKGSVKAMDSLCEKRNDFDILKVAALLVQSAGLLPSEFGSCKREYSTISKLEKVVKLVLGTARMQKVNCKRKRNSRIIGF